MGVITDYSLGVQAVFNSKTADSSLSNYDYFSTALSQSYQVYVATGVVAKTLQAYNRPMTTFPWYVRLLAITIVPFSICFEINRWSSNYQPHFWIKKTIHWVCDHTGQFMYATCIVSSIALAIVGNLGMLIGIAVTFSIDQIQNYDVLPAYYSHVLKTINTLVSILFSKEIFSFWILATELAGDLYFLRSVQNKPLIHEITTSNIVDKTVADVKNNVSHIHFKPKIKKDLKDLLDVFDGFTWDLTQMEELLLEDNYWKKRADTSTDPISYVKSLRKYIEDVCSDPNQLPLLQLNLKVITQYLRDYPEEHLANKKLVLNVIAQLRENFQEGTNRLGEIAKKCYEKIEFFLLEEQVLQLLYKRRREIFNQFFDKELCKKIVLGFSKESFHSCVKYIFDSHMGINFFLTDRTSSLSKAFIYAMCAAEEVDTKGYFCDQEDNNFYTSESIVNLLMNQLGTTLSWDSVNQWWQEQNTPQDIDDIKDKISSIQTAETYLKDLYQVNQEHYNNLVFLKNNNLENHDYFYDLIKQDCKDHFKDLTKKIKVNGNKEEFADKICTNLQEAVGFYPKIEKLLVSMLLKMGFFQLKD